MIVEQDPANRRTFARWSEAGLEFASNIIAAGGRIEGHAHHYDHHALIKSGWFDVVETSPEGAVERYQVASSEFRTADPAFDSRGSMVLIKAWHRHEFTLRAERGEVLCIWVGE